MFLGPRREEDVLQPVVPFMARVFEDRLAVVSVNVMANVHGRVQTSGSLKVTSHCIRPGPIGVNRSTSRSFSLLYRLL